MLRLLVALVLLAGAALSGATAVLPSRAATASEVRYRIVFTGSGGATSNYPPNPDGTVFTSTIDWKLVYLVRIQFPTGAPGSPWSPQPGSAIEGTSVGVATPSGIPIEPGCERIGLSLDPTAGGASFATRNGRTVGIGLAAPGFQSGALLKYSPNQCANPFPLGSGGPGCTDAAGYRSPTVQLDTTKGVQSWKLAGRCDIPEQGQTAHWSGTVTATPVVVTRYAGTTSQICSSWDTNCHAGSHLVIRFEVSDGVVGNLFAQDEGGCRPNGHAQNGITPPPGKLDRRGSFHLAYTAQGGAYHATVSGSVSGSTAQGVLSSTERYDAGSGQLDPHGRVLCHTANVRWTARRTG